MKKFLNLILMFCFFLFLASTGWAYVITDGVSWTDVGYIDSLVDTSTTPGNSGDQAELDWVNAELGGTTYTLDNYFKHDISAYLFNVYDNQIDKNLMSDTYAFQLDYAPDYFLIKFGTGKDYLSHALWANNDYLDWAVIDMGVDGLNIKSIEAFSHYAEIGGGVPVPEPATLLLLGAGLIGLAGTSRKQFKK